VPKRITHTHKKQHSKRYSISSKVAYPSRQATSFAPGKDVKPKKVAPWQSNKLFSRSSFNTVFLRQASFPRCGGLLAGMGVFLLLLFGAYATSTLALAKAHQLTAIQQFDLARQNVQLAQRIFPIISYQNELRKIERLSHSHQAYEAGLKTQGEQRFTESITDFATVIPDDRDFINAQSHRVSIAQLIGSQNSPAAQDLTQAKEQIVAQNHAAALSFLALIPSPSIYYTEANQLIDSIRRSTVATSPLNEIGPALTNTGLPTSTTHGLQLHIPILMYHYISTPPNIHDPIRVDLSVTPDMFESQLRYLISHKYHTITLDQAYAAIQGNGLLPPNPVVLTFDDGYRDFYEQAFPLLKKYQLKASVYIVTNFTNNPAYVTWDMIRQMSDSGLIEIASHALDHPDLRTKNSVDLAVELQHSKQLLEEHTGKVVDSFCYPYGAYDARVLEAVHSAGYIGATTTLPGSWHSASDLLTLTRVRIKNAPMSGYLR
jgi:peptidoglycan/xylan/chitin deacetylase (PgdA/CDA1 family)